MNWKKERVSSMWALRLPLWPRHALSSQQFSFIRWMDQFRQLWKRTESFLLFPVNGEGGSSVQHQFFLPEHMNLGLVFCQSHACSVFQNSLPSVTCNLTQPVGCVSDWRAKAGPTGKCNLCRSWMPNTPRSLTRCWWAVALQIPHCPEYRARREPTAMETVQRHEGRLKNLQCTNFWGRQKFVGDCAWIPSSAHQADLRQKWSAYWNSRLMRTEKFEVKNPKLNWKPGSSDFERLWTHPPRCFPLLDRCYSSGNQTDP